MLNEYRSIGYRDIDNLTDILNITADIISHTEYDVISNANNHNNRGVYLALLHLVKELRDLLLNSDDNYVRVKDFQTRTIEPIQISSNRHDWRIFKW